MNDTIEQTRAHIAEIGKLMYQRHLTDTAGGNLSVRVDDNTVCLTPRYAGGVMHWQLRPEDVLVVTLDGEKLDGDGELSRESKVHLALHRELGAYGKAVVHCHARNMMVFAAMAQPMPAVLEGTLKFGELPVSGYAPSHSDDLATFVTEAMATQVDKIPGHAAGVIAPWHGLFVMGKDLNLAFDAAERMDTNAYCILMGKMLGGQDNLAAQRHALVEGITPYKQGEKH